MLFSKIIGRYERSRYRQKYRRLGRLMDDALTIYPLVLLRFNSRALALEFTILTAARSGKVWTVPAARMKGGREHRVALSRRALAMPHENRQRDGSRL